MPSEVLQAECYCILRDLLRVVQERPEGWQEEARHLIAVKERLRCGERVNGARWPVVPASVQAASRHPPELVEAELERLQRNLAKVGAQLERCRTLAFAAARQHTPY